MLIAHDAPFTDAEGIARVSTIGIIASRDTGVRCRAPHSLTCDTFGSVIRAVRCAINV